MLSPFLPLYFMQSSWPIPKQFTTFEEFNVNLDFLDTNILFNNLVTSLFGLYANRTLMHFSSYPKLRDAFQVDLKKYILFFI